MQSLAIHSLSLFISLSLIRTLIYLHLGNLLRTKDGKLCILDWGMTLEVPKDLQYSILELIAHINSEDFDAIPRDFVNLGFTPSDKIDKLMNSGISDGLSFAFRQLSKGGNNIMYM